MKHLRREFTMSRSFLCTYSSGDPWFHGCWFLRPSETMHLPTHMFYPNELLMSNIADTNPMRSVIGKCAVLTFKDFCTCELHLVHC